MSALRSFVRPRLWLGVWIFGWALCIALSLIPNPPIPTEVPEGDKLGHTLAYAMLSLWAVLIFESRAARWRAAWALVGLGVVLEVAQGTLTTYRSMDAFDGLADGVGVLLGQCLAWSSAQTALQRLDRRWFA